jgi:hypothetical protein
MGQNKILNLQQMNFKDKMLEKILVDITKSDCFRESEFYVLNFFTSNMSKNEYYLSIDKFRFNDDTLNSITYYIVINNIVFLVPKGIPNGLFNLLSVQKKFSLKEGIPHIGGDYNFLINGTLNGYYRIIFKSCSE